VRLFESTLQKHPVLNPKLWDGEKLKPDVRVALLRFGRAWQEFAKIPDSLVRDIIMIGGNASYFYNDTSDIDVHLLINRAELGFGPIVDDFLADRKALWTTKHHAKVRGYSLEPYAQDICDSYSVGQGVYSLIRDEWIQKPTHSDYDPEHDRQLARKVDHWQKVIIAAIEDGDEHKVSALKERIRAKRGAGIKKSGELNQDNLVFKELRNLGVLDRMDDFLGTHEDERLSLQ
jgi:hypothetical protein